MIATLLTLLSLVPASWLSTSALDEPLFLERPDAFLVPVGGDEPGYAAQAVVTTCGSDAKDYILEVNGGGLALGDFDGDGWNDIFVVDGSTIERVQAEEPGFPPRLFLNRGADGPGSFVPAGPEWELAGGRWGMGVATGDLNGDGFLDVVITEWGRDRVILNAAGQGFREITDEAGLQGTRWGTSAALFDFDGDRVLDLVVANYLAFYMDEEVEARTSQPAKWEGFQVMRGPEGLTPVHDQIYRGVGDGSFEALNAREIGFEPETGAGFSLGVMPLDYDRDGDLDLYIANDSTSNYLFQNLADGSFEFVHPSNSGVGNDGSGKEQAGMGVASADINADGRPDLHVTNFSGETNALYVSGRRGFREQSARYGLRGPSITKLGWGTGFGDFDLDGDLDAFVLNGHVYPQADGKGTDTSYAQDDQLYRFRSPKFQAEPLSDAGPTVSRAGASADLDNDGDLDLVCLQMNGPLRVLENQTIRSGAQEHPHWLRVQLRSAASDRFGIGALVELEWQDGEVTHNQVAELSTAGGFQAARPPELHFGLGAVDSIERLTVRWPGGALSTLENVAANQVLKIEEAQ